MAFSRRRFAEIVNSTHPFLKLPVEIHQIVYSMSQLNISKHDIFTLTFGGANLLFEGFGQHLFLLHVCRRFRQELLPITFAERQACFLYRGAISIFVPPTIALLPTDVLQVLSTMQLGFNIIIPKRITGLDGMLTMHVQVRLRDGRYDVDVNINNNWGKCDHIKLLDHLGTVLDQLQDSLQSSMGSRDVSEDKVSMHIVDNGRPVTVALVDIDAYNTHS